MAKSRYQATKVRVSLKFAVGEALFGRANCPRRKAHWGSENGAFRWELARRSLGDIGRRSHGSGGRADGRADGGTGVPSAEDFALHAKPAR
jgi:hypothetical protein